jgi:putative flippase GtrA
MANNSFRAVLIKNQVARFVFSAGIGFLVDIFAFYLFYHNLFEQRNYTVLSFRLTNYTLSLSISFYLGVIVNFLITRYFVFHESVSSPVKQFTRFAFVAIIGFYANLFVLKVFIREFGWYPPFARVMAALSLFFASYFIHKFFSFSLSLRHHATGTGSNAGN